MKVFTIVLFSSLFLSSIALAYEGELRVTPNDESVSTVVYIDNKSTTSSSPIENECNDVKSGYDKTYCFEKLFIEADKDLNKIYNLLKDSLPPEKKKQLLVEERKWIVNRNENCTRQGTIMVICNLKMTRSRTEELRARLNWMLNHPTALIKLNPQPRRTDFGDCGYRDTFPRAGWYDAQGQGVSNDYCRYVGNHPDEAGSPGNWFACALAGGNWSYSAKNKYTDTASWLKTFQPLLPGDKCYQD